MSHTVKKTLQSVWHTHSYVNFKRYIDYFCPTDPVFKHINDLPPIVSHFNIQKLRDQLKECEEGKRSLLHMGDCAQPFEHVHKNILETKINFFRICQQKIAETKNRPSTIVGRIAGQYAKPRSTEFVVVNGKKIHNYKGDNVNNVTEAEREPSQHRLTQGYFNSIATHNYIQSMFPDLFTSHEGLILPYEAALTRQIKNNHYCLSAHMLWIGERTRQLDGAHVQFFRGIQNPIGVKVSNKIQQDDFEKLVRTLNPKNQKGKLLVIIRMGKNNIDKKLQQLIECKKKGNLNFMFVTDPMHGNTFESKHEHKLKTRSLSHIMEEIRFFQSKMNENKLPYGYSLEATYESVTQCYGLGYPNTQEQISMQKYKSKCDPRLNWTQTLNLLKQIDKN